MRAREVLYIFVFILLFLTFDAYAQSMRIVLVTDIGGLGDGSFNDSCWFGIQRVVKEFKLEAKVLQSFKQEEYLQNLSKGMGEDALVVTVGLPMADAVAKVAVMHPKGRFVLVDGVVNAPNVKCILFKEEEGSFLAGLIAGAVTKSGKVGYIGGMETPYMVRFISGYKAGVKTYSSISHKDIKILGTYVRTLNDPAKGKEVALSLFDQGVDVVFQVAGRSGYGVVEAAKERKEGAFVIGVDLDEELLSSDRVLTSVLKKVDVAIYLSLKDIICEGFSGGVYQVGLREGCLSFAETEVLKRNLSQEAFDFIDRVRKMVIEGAFIVPNSEEELVKFTPPRVL